MHLHILYHQQCKSEMFSIKNIDSTKMNCQYNTQHSRSEMNWIIKRKRGGISLWRTRGF